MENEFPRRGGAHTFEQLEAEALAKAQAAAAAAQSKAEEEVSEVEERA